MKNIITATVFVKGKRSGTQNKTVTKFSTITDMDLYDEEENMFTTMPGKSKRALNSTKPLVNKKHR